MDVALSARPENTAAGFLIDATMPARGNTDAYGHEETTMQSRIDSRREWLNEKCITGAIMDNELNAECVRDYISKWDELVKVGDRIRKTIRTPPIIVAFGGKHYSVEPNIGRLPHEAPLCVEEVQVLE